MKAIIHKILYPESPTDYMAGNKKTIVFHYIYEWELGITKNDIKGGS